MLCKEMDIDTTGLTRQQMLSKLTGEAPPHQRREHKAGGQHRPTQPSIAFTRRLEKMRKLSTKAALRRCAMHGIPTRGLARAEMIQELINRAGGGAA